MQQVSGILTHPARSWGDHSAHAVLRLWRAFLATPLAEQDSSYATIKQVVSVLEGVAARQQAST